jgi:hypothetical protein
MKYLKIFEDYIDRESLLNRAKELSHHLDNTLYGRIYKGNEEQILHELAIQANSSESEKRGAIKMAGKELIDIAQKLFPDAKVGSKFKSI